ECRAPCRLSAAARARFSEGDLPVQELWAAGGRRASFVDHPRAAMYGRPPGELSPGRQRS
ncbi:MAG TPA: hypothetical protein VKL22_00495, partial [Actinomycetota bacterium]|nr:hypothetical protein [Actinomycetota bacterium]